MEKKVNKYVKVGNVIKTKKGNFTLALGNNRAKDDKWNYSVEFTVKDAKGNVVYQQTDGFLNLFDPRKRPNASEEEVARIPETLKFEVTAIRDIE